MGFDDQLDGLVSGESGGDAVLRGHHHGLWGRVQCGRVSDGGDQFRDAEDAAAGVADDFLEGDWWWVGPFFFFSYGIVKT